MKAMEQKIYKRKIKKKLPKISIIQLLEKGMYNTVYAICEYDKLLDPNAYLENPKNLFKFLGLSVGVGLLGLTQEELDLQGNLNELNQEIEKMQPLDFTNSYIFGDDALVGVHVPELYPNPVIGEVNYPVENALDEDIDFSQKPVDDVTELSGNIGSVAVVEHQVLIVIEETKNQDLTQQNFGVKRNVPSEIQNPSLGKLEDSYLNLNKKTKC
uniref:Uncharacterized protein n=1 Tax=Scherffelia dubia TaxID=3190 RepID=A0A142BYD4_SCHDU|nr:hypothetical protein [Scherffelia dubia]YP_009241562.1 hypothetical protein [Scherffelia dubia]AMP43426.1 hypothetical protein [Scherffelia dubia]AMP43469.1 hypothetical protein [Scherffelia dubia]